MSKLRNMVKEEIRIRLPSTHYITQPTAGINQDPPVFFIYDKRKDQTNQTATRIRLNEYSTELTVHKDLDTWKTNLLDNDAIDNLIQHLKEIGIPLKEEEWHQR